MKSKYGSGFGAWWQKNKTRIQVERQESKRKYGGFGAWWHKNKSRFLSS